MQQTDLLNQRDMAEFGTFIALDLCQRSGKRGRRQKQSMSGMFMSRLIGTATFSDPSGGSKRKSISLPFRRSDFDLRVALLVRGWHKTGLSILCAAERVAQDYAPFLRMQLGKGKRGKRSRIGEGTEFGETVRTIYYKVLKRYPELDVFLEEWFWYYLSWLDWLLTTNEAMIELTVTHYEERGQFENASAFRSFASRIRQNPPRHLLSLPRRSLYRDERADNLPEYF